MNPNDLKNMTTLEKLDLIERLKNQSLSRGTDELQALKAEVASIKELVKQDLLVTATLDRIEGKPGLTPIKGVDFFTDEEIAEFVQIIQDSIRIPLDGETPRAGVDFFTEDEAEDFKKDVSNRVLADLPIIEVPEFGVDFFTEDDKAKLIGDITQALPVPEFPILDTNSVSGLQELLDKYVTSEMLDGRIRVIMKDTIPTRFGANSLLPYDGSGSLEIGGEITGGTDKSVLFVSPDGVLAEDNANFEYDSDPLVKTLKVNRVETTRAIKLAEWQATTDYLTGDTVVQGGAFYTRIADGTSGAAFDPAEEANWNLVSVPSSISPWTAGAYYEVGEVVTNAGTVYRTTTQHTASGTFDDAEATNFAVISNYTNVGAWAANTHYPEGKQVSVAGILYRRTATGTSGATFDATEVADWTTYSDYYEQAFVVADWVSVVGNQYTLTIPATDHLKALTVKEVTIQEDDGTSYLPFTAESITINKATGDIVITIDGAIDPRIDCRVLIK